LLPGGFLLHACLTRTRCRAGSPFCPS
jgi:hypothetical protein